MSRLLRRHPAHRPRCPGPLERPRRPAHPPRAGGPDSHTGAGARRLAGPAPGLRLDRPIDALVQPAHGRDPADARRAWPPDRHAAGSRRPPGHPPRRHRPPRAADTHGTGPAAAGDRPALAGRAPDPPDAPRGNRIPGTRCAWPGDGPHPPPSPSPGRPRLPGTLRLRCAGAVDAPSPAGRRRAALHLVRHGPPAPPGLGSVRRHAPHRHRCRPRPGRLPLRQRAVAAHGRRSRRAGRHAGPVRRAARAVGRTAALRCARPGRAPLHVPGTRFLAAPGPGPRQAGPVDRHPGRRVQDLVGLGRGRPPGRPPGPACRSIGRGTRAHRAPAAYDSPRCRRHASGGRRPHAALPASGPAGRGPGRPPHPGSLCLQRPGPADPPHYGRQGN